MQIDLPEAAVADKSVLQLIIFHMGSEEFALPISVIQEITRMGLITPIPNSPAFVTGIMNVRDEVVTVISVKTRFSSPTLASNEAKHIIVTRQEDNLLGLLVDEVGEVLHFCKKDIRPSSSLLPNIDKKYVNGVIPHEGRLIVLLDLPLILAND